MAWGALRGFRAGLVVEVVSTVGLIVALVAALAFMDAGADWLRTTFPQVPSLPPFAAFAVIFLLVFWGIGQLALVVRRTLHLTALGTLDRFGGAALGVVKSAVALSLLLWALGAVGVSIPTDYTVGTVVYPRLVTLGTTVADTVAVVFPAVRSWIEEMLTAPRP